LKTCPKSDSSEWLKSTRVAELQLAATEEHEAKEIKCATLKTRIAELKIRFLMAIRYN
jgi:hypothetical protein